jgi:hypothetical protein
MAGLTPCRWTAMRCREAAFQRFLGVDSNEAAAARVRELCEVGSRAELDRDPAAQARWDERIRRAYLNHQRQPTNHNQDQEM